ncbi:TatD family hydrolase [Campylobacter ureolyticus]|uniref:TatD family hydrolase n=1 Tax=Campylobacter ureolyticus TaxID=827 RepID=A0A9Q4KKR3_9BACT|nr:TatD family hydrolase [Campylobacter ureolyticus]MCZ6149598.1 TatD family hydrolase [Campylobacter ureolyticus]MCZ6159767.1 TatD family hydrolase [Campylobacter ureolyticus]MCZ6163098.1 TatD family hydrolase [Campylobacter ureolyticus]MCZ6164949.1 TatD family hydrolase [Campylobacter ureolyticus]MCZ6167639.1 TatD family hydrolase [Campylobacter ureolyticus]
MIIDTHCHLDDDSFNDDLDFVIKRAKESGINKIIIPGADIKTLKKARDIAYAYDNVYFAAGVHPYHADEFDINYLKDFLDDRKCVAVGECGLDYFKIKEHFNSDEEVLANKNLQKKIFLDQINLAIQFKKPLIIHARDANEDIYNILKEHSKKLFGAVLHCYNASKLLLTLKDEGFYFGIGGVLTFKNAKNLVEILDQIPLSNMVIETDAPYLAPTPNRGKRNEPAFTTFVAQKMAEILNLEVSKIEEITTKNAEKLFKI